MSEFLYRLGRFGGRHPWRVIFAWVFIVIAVFGLSKTIGGSTSETFRLPGSESQYASDALDGRFPEQSVHQSKVVFHSTHSLDDPKSHAAIDETLSGLGDELTDATNVTDPFDPTSPTLNRDGTTAFATITFDATKLESAEYDRAVAASEPARAAGIEVAFDGLIGQAAPKSEPASELIGIAVAIIVLALAFGSLVAMTVPLVVAIVGLIAGLSGIGIMAGFVTVPEITTIVGMMMGLGVGIDYALFIVARHRQNLAQGMPVIEAIGRANATAGLSVLFAGVTVIGAIAGLQVAGIPMLTMMGWGSAVMVAVTMSAALTLLPAVLAVTGTRLNSLRLPFVRSSEPTGKEAWSTRWAARVVARPKRYGAVAAIILAIAAIPVFALRIGFADAGNEPKESTMRTSYDLLSDAFGPGFNGQLQVVLEDPDNAAIADVAAGLKSANGVAAVSEPVRSKDQALTVFMVTPTTARQDEASNELLTRLRSDVLPQAMSGHSGEALVTGGAAFESDVSDRLSSRMIWFILAVIALAFVALMTVFRSVLVPLKAALLNMISIGAAYGVMVAIFQWGWGASLIGVHETVPINPLAPMLMFAILFGLSMDYEVFLLSRVREHFLRHGDARRAVVEGTGATARIITSAALIMISVFFAFILSPDITTKLFGVGLGVAVLLDVTLVRMVLVPAAMSLLGARAWWLPAWLDRLLPNIDLEGTDAQVPSSIDDLGRDDDPTEDERELSLV
jgi:putative drug exporter of the RND superfamily